VGGVSGGRLSGPLGVEGVGFRVLFEGLADRPERPEAAVKAAPKGGPITPIFLAGRGFPADTAGGILARMAPSKTERQPDIARRSGLRAG
jgi:hypothetical protein